MYGERGPTLNAEFGTALRLVVGSTSSSPLSAPLPKRLFTETQGQYLAFIPTYIPLDSRPPADIDIERYLRVTPPSVHRMVANSNGAASFEASLDNREA